MASSNTSASLLGERHWAKSLTQVAGIPGSVQSVNVNQGQTWSGLFDMGYIRRMSTSTSRIK